MELTGRNIIGNSYSENDKQKFKAVNPVTGKKIEPEFNEATSKDVDLAVKEAGLAFVTYRKKSGKEKAAFLDAIAKEIDSIGDALIHRCMDETGLPEGRLVGERGRTVNQLRLFADVVREGSWVDARIDHSMPDRQPVPKPDVRSMRVALGPVGVFGASNFPLAFSVAGGDTASALAAGCPVVVKAHPSHPGTCELVGRAIHQAVIKTGMPDGTFSLLHGISHDVGMAIVQHPDIKAVGFTGSFSGGKALFDTANSRTIPIPVYAEMGSTNPVFILPGALKEKKAEIAEGLTASVTLGTGQFCTNPGLVFLQQSEAGRDFKNFLSENIKQTSAGVMLNSGIRDNFQKGIKKLSDIKGVNIVSKGEDGGENEFFGSAYLLETSASFFLEQDELEEEVFGPSTLAVSASDKKELMNIARKLGGHLTATIHGTEEDLEEYSELVDILELKVGRVLLNGYPTGVEVCHSMVHGGPYPSTTDSRSTSVGTRAINRFARAVCYQNFPSNALPDELRDDNPLNIWRMVDGEMTKN